jgi:hypothetical protein
LKRGKGKKERVDEEVREGEEKGRRGPERKVDGEREVDGRA